MNTEDDFRIRQTVIQELFGITVNTTKELDAILDMFGDSLKWSSNESIEPTRIKVD